MFLKPHMLNTYIFLFFLQKAASPTMPSDLFEMSHYAAFLLSPLFHTV